MTFKEIVIDANILIRSVLGKRVRDILFKYQHCVTFYLPIHCYREAEYHLVYLMEKRGIQKHETLSMLQTISFLLELVDEELYADYKSEADLRIVTRDPDDWPVVATALLFNCPIWTEDNDFFGAGLST